VARSALIVWILNRQTLALWERLQDELMEASVKLDTQATSFLQFNNSVQVCNIMN